MRRGGGTRVAFTLYEIVDVVLVPSHAHRHTFQSLDGVGADHSDVVSELLETYRAAIVVKPDDASPGAYLGLPEHDLGFA